MTNHTLANVELELEWTSPVAKHKDIYCVQNYDPVNDKLPLAFAEQVSQLNEGQSCSQTFQAKDIIEEGFSTDKVVPFETDFFNLHFKGQHSPPTLYRFYPSAIAYRGLDCSATDYTPFRLISHNDDNMVADRNHPLAKYYLKLSATKIKQFKTPDSHSNRKRNISKLITSRGPGMQAPFEYGDPVFFKQYPFTLPKDKQQQSTENFQLGSNTVEQISKLYSRLLPEYSKVLDLLASQTSYLEEDCKTGLLSGLGENEDKLRKNQRLDTYQVQDLNSDTTLPFIDNSFDDAICTDSISSLTDPLKVMQEIARVVVSGGSFIITFTNNTSSSQNTILWTQLHPFERMQLVLEYFRQSDLFEDLNTFSKRGILRSENDKGITGNSKSESIFAVWGTIK